MTSSILQEVLEKTVQAIIPVAKNSNVESIQILVVVVVVVRGAHGAARGRRISYATS